MSNLLILAAFLRRDWLTTRSYRLGYALGFADTILTLTLYFGIGRLVDRADIAATAALEEGYFSFVVVGMVMLSLGSPILTTFSAQLRSEQTNGSLEVLLSTPAPPAVLIAGLATYTLIQSFLSAALLAGLAVLLFRLRLDVGPWSGLAAAIALVGTLGLFAAVGIVVAGLTVVFKRMEQLLVLVGTTVGVLCGVYYPVDVLPEPLRLLARALPFTWGFEAWRAALLSDKVLLDRLGPLLAVLAVAVPAALKIFAVALDRARRDGSLAQY
jgi:ABC-2 type transport system permease protein